METEHTHLAGGMVELRDRERREVIGRIIPYGEQIQVRGRPESFQRGSVADVDPSSVRLLAYHDPRKPIGRMTELEERDDGAHAVFRISRTALGDELMELAADGVLGFSPGFLPGDQDQKTGTHTRIAAMPEVSLVAFSAYSRAEVLAVRQGENMDTETVATQTAETVDLAPIETRLDGMADQIARLAALSTAPAPGGGVKAPTPLEWFRAEIDALSGKYERRAEIQQRFSEFQTRALANITGTLNDGVTPITDVSGLIVEEFVASQLVNVLDTRRPMLARLGRFPMPRSGYAKIPVVTQHTLVANRTGQKLPANSRKMIVQQQSFEAQWLDGAVDVALELIASSELGVVDMVWTDLLGRYAIATEGYVVGEIEAGGGGYTYTGAPLPTSDYAAFAAAVATQAMTVFTNSGAPATRLAVTSAQWPVLVAMVDANDRRQGAARGQAAADYSVGFTDYSFDLPGGIEVFWGGTALTQAVLFNGESLRVADGGPERVQALNVELMGQDLGVLGRVMFVPRIPAGVVVFGTDPAGS